MTRSFTRDVKLESGKLANGGVSFSGYLVIDYTTVFEHSCIEEYGMESAMEKARDEIYDHISRECLENGIDDNFLREIYFMGYMDAINGKPDYPPKRGDISKCLTLR